MNVADYSENISGTDNNGLGINIGRKVVKYLIGSIFGIAMVLILTAIFSFVMTINAVPDEAINFLPYVIICGGAFVSGLVAVTKIGLSGMINGALCGLVYFVIQILLSLIFRTGTIFTSALLVYLVIDVISAAVGGISAVNVFKSKHS